ncbi:DivIVA domain-containing protein [Mycoplasma sp. P36-A1]|uniref:DivIVA domain-containing protein n=1 Tax=Mycoplasma sp. P36-A1 TaxID=3252900 RepID=UPI003C30168E
MEKLKLNSEIILDKEFDIDIKGYSAKQVDMFLDIVFEDYQSFEKIIDGYEAQIKELNGELSKTKADLESTLKSQVVSNEMVQTEKINTLDILKRLSKLEQEVYNNLK